MRIERVLLLVTVLAAGVVTVLLFQSHHTLSAVNEANAALQRELEEAGRAGAEAGRTVRHLESELRKLRGEREELPRLRGEVGLLRQQLDAASRARPAASTPSQPKPETSPEPAPSQTNFVSTVETLIGNGEVLITGGWPTGDGQRTLTLITPTLTSPGGGGQQIVIRAKLIEAPETLLKGAGLDLPTGVHNAGFLVSEEDLAATMETLQATEGVKVLSAPVITTLPGRTAQVAIPDVVNLPGGEQAITGPMIEAVGEPTTNPGEIALKITASLGLMQ